MKRLRWTYNIMDEIRAEEEAERQRVMLERALFARSIVQDPIGPRFAPDALERWIEYGWFPCAAPTKKQACDQDECQIGLTCQRMAQWGLMGTGEAYPKSQRTRCGAHTRRGTPCQMVVVPGKRRCRLHGGTSTGPKTIEGRQRIAEAQQKRWERVRAEREKAAAVNVSDQAQGAIATPAPVPAVVRLRERKLRRRFSITV